MLQDPQESVHLWAQLRAAEHRLEELVAQHRVATLPIDPLRPRPPPTPIQPLDPFPAPEPTRSSEPAAQPPGTASGEVGLLF